MPLNNQQKNLEMYNKAEVIAMIDGPKKTVAVNMSLELYQAIKKLAEENQRSIPSYIRLVLKEYTKQK